MDHDHKLEQKYEGLMPDAIIFAFNAHSGQFRKIEPLQYIIHPLRVSEFLLKNFNKHPNIEKMRIAAILHDTVEDTWATIEDIEKNFGKEIEELVFEVSKPEIKDKKERNNKYIEILKKGKDESKIIKLADIFDNIILSTDNDLKWKEFISNTKNILEELELKEHDETFTKIKKELLKIINERLDNYEKNK
jgi:(p)ppGpp synthase/HD superfamily hydrolase